MTLMLYLDAMFSVTCLVCCPAFLDAMCLQQGVSLSSHDRCLLSTMDEPCYGLYDNSGDKTSSTNIAM